MAYSPLNPNGQASMANSQPVVVASDQSAVPVSAASLPLPTGAATSTKQSDGSQKTQVVDGSGNVIGATSNALDINIKSGNPTSITANAGADLNTSALALESGGNLATIASAIKAEDAASADADKGIQVLAVRKGTPANTSGTDGDYEPLQVSGGRLWVDASGKTLTVDASGVAVPVTDNSSSLTVDAPVGTPVFVRLSDGSSAITTLPVSLASVPSHAVTNAGTFPVQDSEKVADNAGFTDGTTKVQPAGYIYDEVAGTALTENDAAAARINVNRAQVHAIEDGTTRGRYATVTASNALKVDGSAVTQPVSDASGSLTVDAPVGTPVFVRLSDGASAITTLPVSLASVPSHAVTNAGTFAVQDSQVIADNAGFTDGTSKVYMNGYIYDEVAGTALTENDAAAGRINVNRAQVHAIEDGTTRGRYATVTASNAVKVDGSAVAQPVTDNSGSLTVDAPVGTPVFVTATPNTTGGWSVNSQTALTNSKVAVKASAGNFGGYILYNPNSSAVYVQVFDVASASVTLGTTAPTYVIAIPATATANIEFSNGINHATAITLAATTTATGSTAPSTACTATFLYK